MSVVKPKTPRLVYVDAARGFAMALVCLAHFGIFHLASGGAPRAAELVSRMAQPATTTFMLVSGAVVGMLFSQLGPSEELASYFVDRGLFLLVPGHVLLYVAHLRVIALAPASSHWLFVTDSIGVSLIAGAWLLPRTSSRTRLLVGLGLFAVSWAAYLAWFPSAEFAMFIKNYCLGSRQSARTGVIFPLLPWFGFYLMATALGEKLSAWRAAGINVATRLAMLGLPLIVLSAILRLARRLGTHGLLSPLLDLGQKYPPGPNYLLFGSGTATLLIAACAWLEQKEHLTSLLDGAARVGRASFVVFVVQYFVYYWGFLVLDLRVTAWSPLYFVLSLGVNFSAALLWERFGSNKYLTIGWPWFRRAPVSEPALPSAALTRRAGGGKS